MFARTFYLLAIGFCAGLLVYSHIANMNAMFGWSLVGFFSACIGFHSSPGPLNVWKMQRKMMRASGQATPEFPTVTKDSVLYIALMLEELSETLTAQLRVLAVNSSAQTVGTVYETADARDKMVALIRAMNTYATNMSNMSANMRELLATRDDFAIVASIEQAQDMVDGAADVMVIAAGLNESMGLPGEDSYFIVQTSNLSKCNPDTGVIDKTPDGKWVKGRNYRPPTPRIKAMLQDLMATE